jgi:hypothetical protein
LLLGICLATLSKLMADEIQKLIDSLRGGQYENPTEKIGLLSAALQEQKADLALLLSLLRAPQIPLCLAAIDACRERREPEMVKALLSLADNSELRIRLKLAEILRYHSDPQVVETLKLLFKDSDADIRQTAIKSSFGRPELRNAQETALAKDTDWNVRMAAANALDAQKAPQVIKPLFEALIHDNDEDVRRRCGEIIEKGFVESPAATERQLPSEITQLSKTEKALKYLGAHHFPKLIAWITSLTTINVDPELLARFGTDLTALAANGTLPRAYHTEPASETVLKLFQREPWRSIALLGPAAKVRW